MEPVPALDIGRRARLERARLRLALACLVFSLASFLLGIVVGATLSGLGLTLFLLMGFEISRPVSHRKWLDSGWSALTYGLCLAPVLALVALFILAWRPYHGDLPRGWNSAEDLVIVLGGWLAGLGSLVASLHVMRRRGPVGFLRVRRYWWIPVLVVVFLFFAAPLLLNVALVAMAAGILLSSIVWILAPKQRPVPATAEAALTLDAPTFHAFRGN